MLSLEPLLDRCRIRLQRVTARRVARVTTGVVAAFVLVWSASSGAAQAPPVAPVRPVVDDYFGTKIGDPYRWMEDGKSSEFRTWLEQQGAYARAVLDRIAHRQDIAKAIRSDQTSNPNLLKNLRVRGSRIFAARLIAGSDAPKIFVREGVGGTDRLLIDPATSDGHQHSIMSWEPSWNGRYVAYMMDTDGSEAGPVRVMDVASGKNIDGSGPITTIVNLQWVPDDRGFAYLHSGTNAKTSKSHLLALHRIGSDFSADRDVLGYGVGSAPAFADNERAELALSPDSPFAVLGIATSDGGRRRFYVAPWRAFAAGTANWRQVAGLDDGVTAILPHGESLYVVSGDNAPRYKVLRTPASAPDVQHADVVVPAGAAVVQGPGGLELAGYNALYSARDALYVIQFDAGSSAVLRVPWNDWTGAKRLTLPYTADVTDVATDTNQDGAYLSVRGWTHAGDNVRYDPRTAKLASTGLQTQTLPDNPPDLVSEDVFVRARDGASIPLTLIYAKGLTHDGNTPTILYGYGAYGAPITPFLDPTQVAWYRLGGIVAIAHVRGGGEYGEAWHIAGKGSSKPNTWRDAIDSAEYLIANHYTSPRRLAILSMSAGGIFVGRAVTERPDLFAAAIMGVPLVDTLRFETQGAGRANRNEFGTVAKPDEFRALYEMSTYEHIRPGVHYPAILLYTGLNDRRVPPWQPAKAAARFEAADRNGKPVLLRVDDRAGHFTTGDAQGGADLAADWYAFVLWQMGVPGYQPANDGSGTTATSAR